MFIIANWKQNLQHADVLEWLVKFKDIWQEKDQIRVGIAPSYTEIGLVHDFLNNWNLADKIEIMSQDVSPFAQGAYTGEVGARQLCEYEVKSAIIGHSERRTNFGESTEAINRKIQNLRQNKIQPVICISNTDQLQALDPSELENAVIAYEPIESISTTKDSHPANPNMVAQFIEKIRNLLATKNIVTIYGGSVDAESIQQYLEVENIQGFLVGNASIQAQSFNDIILAVSKKS